MRALLRVLIPFTVLSLVLYAWLEGASGPPRAPAPDVDPRPPPSVESTSPRLPEPTTAALVIRVKTADGKDVPEGTRAGYTRFGGADRLRLVGPDGACRFTDAPVGRIEAIAEAAGYERGRTTTIVVPGVPNEAVLTLTAAKSEDGR